MMLALHAVMRCLALSACCVLFVWCVCVIAVSVLPTERLQRRWERTPWSCCIRWSMQLAACVRVDCACARFVGMFVHAILSGLLTG